MSRTFLLCFKEFLHENIKIYQQQNHAARLAVVQRYLAREYCAFYNIPANLLPLSNRLKIQNLAQHF